MKRRVIAGAIILGLGAVTFALAQQMSQQPKAGGSHYKPRDPAATGFPADRGELHRRVARLRAEIEVLQLEHDLMKERLTPFLKETADAPDAGRSRQVARDWMRIGAELVGKGPEFESAMQEKGDEIWKAVAKAAGNPSPAEIDQLKQDFLRITTELNRRKIDLVELEVHLDASM
jgi:hypothetical protein